MKNDENSEKEEATATPKENRKTDITSNKRSSKTKEESPSSPPPVHKKRVCIITWGNVHDDPEPISNEPELKSQSDQTICITITASEDSTSIMWAQKKYNEIRLVRIPLV